MQDFRKRRHPSQELLRAALATAGVLAVGVLAFVAARGAWGMYQKFEDASAASAAAEARLAALVGRRAAVGAEVAALETPRGVEGELRERYGVARAGEGQITLVHQAASSSSDVGQSGDWFASLWHALFVW